MTSGIVRALALAIVVAACSSANKSPADPPPNKFVLTGDQKADWDQILGLENQAKALVKTDGCSGADQCRSAAVGSRACGGPRYYLVYCATTTDTVALFSKLKEIAAAEEEYNRRYQIASTCEFRMPSKVAFAGGACLSQ
jgi:hypothetical protein